MALLLLLTVATTSAMAFLEESPLQKEAAAHKFPLVHQADDKQLAEKLQLTISGSHIMLRKGAFFPELVISGQTKQGKKWTVVEMFDSLGGAEFFTADLDKNGTEDLIIVSANGACGALPNADLFVLLMDQDNRPWPWETHGYFSFHKNSFPDIVTNPVTQKACVYCTALLETSRDPLIKRMVAQTTVYEASDCRWHRQDGLSGRKMPFVQKFDPPCPIVVKPTMQEQLIQNGDNSGATSELTRPLLFTDANPDLPNGFISRQFETFLIDESQPSLILISDLYTPEAKKLLKERTDSNKLMKTQKISLKGIWPIYITY